MSKDKGPSDLYTQLELVMSEFQQKLSQKDETIKAKDGLIQELQANLEKMEKENVEFQKAQDKMRMAVENMGKFLNHDVGGSRQVQDEKEEEEVDVQPPADEGALPNNESSSKMDPKEHEVIDLTLDDDDDDVYDNEGGSKVKLEETGIDNFMEVLDEDDDTTDYGDLKKEQDFNTLVNVKMEQPIIPMADPSSSGSSQNPMAVCVFEPNHRKDTFRVTGFWCKCGKQFSSKQYLSRHIRYFTQKMFECKKCGKEYSDWCRLKAHLKRRHNATVLGGTIGCSLCGRQYATRAGYREHRRQFHSSS